MARQLCRFLLFLSGWRVKGTFPPETFRSVMIAAPHTTNWDAYYLKLAAVVLGIPMRVAIKDNWTKGVLGWFMKPMGALGIDRSPKEGSQRLSQVDGMARLFEKHEELSLVIAPEGTRKYRERWKMGYYWVANSAKVPIVLGFLDYKNKLAGVADVVVHVSGDPSADIPQINDFYREITPKFPSKFSVDLRYEPDRLDSVEA